MKKRTFLKLLVLANTVIMLALSKAANIDEKKLAQNRKID